MSALAAGVAHQDVYAVEGRQRALRRCWQRASVVGTTSPHTGRRATAAGLPDLLGDGLRRARR
jgi:hypothetical protein